MLHKIKQPAMANQNGIYIVYFLSIICICSTFQVCAVAVERVKGSQALDNFPIIDGHNDLANNLYVNLSNKINNFEFNRNLSFDSLFGRRHCTTCHTDLVRLKQGKVGAQFWAAYIDCVRHKDDLVGRTLEQIDVIKRFINKYKDVLKFTSSADGIIEAIREKKIASLIGVEGGHSIDDRLSILRLYYDLGVRYMTLTHMFSLAWADASPVDTRLVDCKLKNLTEFGKRVVLEMNRLGMMVDLSHVSHGVMVSALNISKAPVIFSHSSAYAIRPHHRNVRNDVLLKLRQNGGLVMVNFFADFIGIGNVTIQNVADHINYIADLIGVDHVGIGADYDGVNEMPVGLEDVSKYPALFDLLYENSPDKWTLQNLEKLAGRNLIRVFRKVEQVRDSLSNCAPDETLIQDTLKSEENLLENI